MYRIIDEALFEWKDSTERRVLLVRGARQVGKTYSIRNLGNSFVNFLEVNFEENSEISTFFSGNLTPTIICEKLSAYYNVPIIEGKTLLFFDEIQACPNCIRSLRFFYEQMPELHVIAAGSLLEFALSELPSFGVGRITSLYMYPLSFVEFLDALDEEQLKDILLSGSVEHPLDEVFHNKLLGYLKIFMVTGGLPAIIESYRKNKDLRKCDLLLAGLIAGFEDDFAKYRKNSPVPTIRETFQSAAFQSGGKFKYSTINSDKKHYELKQALDLLQKAGLIHKVYHSSSQGLPLGAQVNSKKFKVIIFDIGIHQHLLGLNLGEYLVMDNVELINKGVMAEVFVGLELIKANLSYKPFQLFYWHRESKSSNAEVDYIIEDRNQIIPVEVKSSKQGAMQSMHLFLNEKKLDKGIRLSSENFNTYNKIEIVPLYAATSIKSTP